ncbi:LexA family transcriptional regulator [Dysgonomonas sp.]|uniref:LexA family transcriptional regulator n=1 Tax=Dysgonomonas sp. TaxID=1891233 RepID=UPI0027BAE9B9|nr:LexA family transcriptional regulator [Dysgonomonas sp.]
MKKFNSSLFNLKDFMDENNIKTQKDMESILGVTQSFISRVKNGRELMPDYCLEKLSDEFGYENVNKFIILNKTNKSENNEANGVPYYENIDVSASITTMFNDNKETPTFYIDYQHFNDCTAYLPVVGDSMYPRYASGEIVAVKQIFNKDIIQWGEAYLIVCNDNADSLRTIKLVHPCEKDETKIILRASNPNYKGDTPISKDDIISMFIVKGKITRNQL